MERLTSYDPNVGLMINEEERLLSSKGYIDKGEMQKIMRHLAEKLAEYEGTGLTPEQIRQMDELYAEKCKELADLRERLKEYEELEEQRQWISCSDRMPKNEQNVEITYTRQDYRTGEKQYLTARAFYEDGTLTTENSAYNWRETDNWEYDEQTDLFIIIIPEGWYEKVSFTEHFDIVDMPVIAWRPLPEPYKGEKTLKKMD